MTADDLVKIILGVIALATGYFAARRGDRTTQESSKVEQSKNDNTHQLALIQETRLGQQEALHNCTERLDQLEARLDSQDTAHQMAIQKWDEERAAWDEEKKKLRHELTNLKVTVKASTLIIERQDAELTYWRNRSMEDQPKPGGK